jgi:hypothetical protein
MARVRTPCHCWPLASSKEEGKAHGQYLRERAASCERERKRDRESGEEMQCNYSRGGGCYKKKRKTETRGPLHDDIHFCYRKWYKGNKSLEEKITSYSLCPKKESFSLPKKSATFNFDQIYLAKY